MTYATRIQPFLAAVALPLLLGACVGGMPQQGDTQNTGITPLITYPVTSNDTPYSRCLAKLGTLSGYDNLPTFAVGSVVDKTGKLAAGDEGFVISQGATEMVISALYKTRKARLVERFDLRLVNAELQFSKNSMSGRAVVDGAVRPSDFLLVGAVTELNYNILTGGAGLWVAGMGAGMRGVIINVALDLRVIDTGSLEIVYVSSLQKQIVGYEVEANVFRFFGSTLIEADAGHIRNEPLQLGLRSVVEMSVLDIMTDFLSLPNETDCEVSPAHHVPAVAVDDAAFQPQSRN
ncbi:CsgG/HfaB family protein [Ferrovibrio xuzhouensis]|uniref:CsgG/HfaB family protein n=1 Tax=Ferrovibrio xuzhouensis TaxID=1576914 RepID=A0ABV7VB30_9PROT